MIEKPKSAQEILLEQYRFVPVQGLDTNELQRRLELFFDRLPRLKIYYVAHMLAFHKDGSEISRS